MAALNPFKRLTSKAGSEDAARSTFWTTPWAWRTEDGIYVGHNREVWLYRELQLNPLQWEDPSRRIAVGNPLANVLNEVGATSKDMGGGLRSFSRNREVHLVSVTWEAPARVPEGTPEDLADYLNNTLQFLVPYKSVMLGVKLRSSLQVAATKGSASTSLIDQLKGLTTSALGESVPDLDSYEADIELFHGILARNGAKVPGREAMAQLESWYNLGRGPDVSIQETKDLVYVDDFDVIEMAAVMRFDNPVMRAPNAQWMLEALTHPDGPSVISVRGELEPASVARARLRRSQRKVINQMEEEAATGDLERAENSTTFQLAQETENYFAGGREPLFTECSIVMARRTREADETYIDELQMSYGIEMKPLEHRQLAALDETLPCSDKRVNPFLQDVSIGMLSYAGLQGFSNLGDTRGMYVGLTDPDYTPCWVDPFGAPAANLPPAMAIFGDPGGGKAQPLDARILTPTGWTTMGELTVGDSVIGSDGLPHQVTGVFPQGEKEIFRVTFSDGSSTEACDEHLWSVRRTQDRSRGREGWRVMSLAELRGQLHDSDGKRRWHIPVMAPLQLPEADLVLDPYAVGLLIGDGSLTSYVGFSTADDELKLGLEAALPGSVKLVHYAGHDWRVIGTKAPGGNPVRGALKELGLLGKRSYEKTIPEAYLRGSVAQRTALLQGLMDTDGEVAKNNSVKLSTSSPVLAEQAVELVRGLGGTATISVKKEPSYTHKGEKRVGRPSYRVTIDLPAEIAPFRLTRKAAAYVVHAKRQPTRSIVSVEAVGTKEAQCIMVDAADHLYVTDDHVVTHNTFLMQMMAVQAALAGVTVIFVNPKGFDSLSPTAELVGGEVVRMSQLLSSGGYFDPFRYAEPEMAAEIAATHILSVLGQGMTDTQELKLTVGLKRGALAGARCVMDALKSVDDPQVRQMVEEQVESSTTFALGCGSEPQAPLGNVGGGLTLIEFDRKLDLPDASTPVASHSRSQRIALAAIRLVTRASLEILNRAGGGMFLLDEAWTFLSSSDGLGTLQQLGREGRSLNILPVFATQRVADLVKEGVNLEGYLSRVFVMKLMEEREAKAALTLCGLEPTPARLSWLREAGPRRAEGEIPGRPALALHRDLKNRHSAVLIGPVPEPARIAFSTNPEERKKRREAREAQENAREHDSTQE